MNPGIFKLHAIFSKLKEIRSYMSKLKTKWDDLQLSSMPYSYNHK